MASSTITENEEEIYIPEEWSEAANSIAYDSTTSPPPTPIVFVCGPKNCGKSTFSRHLLSVLLQRYRKVGYLDTDVGQPEFTAPGLLSLTVVDKITQVFPQSDLTIPCIKTPERCFFFGDVSSKRDPTAYLEYIYTLYEYYQKEFCMFNKNGSHAKAELPLVINTPGWVKGVGYDVLVDMLRRIAPTHVVKIKISSDRKNLPDGAFWLDDNCGGDVNLIEINSPRQDSFNRSVPMQKDACLLRDFRIMAYFRQCIPRNLNFPAIKEFANALASHPPYQVPISSIKIRHLHCKVPVTEVFYSLNATIVGLAVSSEQSGNLPWCVGLGIVRGIDTFKGLLYMITPVPVSILEKVDLLLQGFIHIPTRFLEVKGCIPAYIVCKCFGHKLTATKLLKVANCFLQTP